MERNSQPISRSIYTQPINFGKMCKDNFMEKGIFQANEARKMGHLQRNEL